MDRWDSSNVAVHNNNNNNNVHACITVVIIQPRNTRFCDANDKTVMEMRMADAKRLGVAGFMTEWSALSCNIIITLYNIIEKISYCFLLM